jgi:glycosyltransferase involved in cell wall biosynthesis
MSEYTILHTIESSEPGGAETVLLDLASKVDSRRFRSVALLVKKGWLQEQLQERGVKTFLVECGSWYDFRLPRTIARVVREEKADLIHSHLPDQNFYSCLAGVLVGRKTIVTYHGPIEITSAQGMRQVIKIQFVRHAAASVVVVCDYVGAMLQNVGFKPKKIVRIYNGIDTKLYGDTQGSNLRSELGVPLDTKLVGMIAHLHLAKGYEFFIQAARKVVDALPKVRFVAVGEIKEPIWKELSTLIENLGLKDHVHFLGLRDDIPGILHDLDVFVLSSRSEGFPLAVLEAMAAGRPIVVTRSGGPQELVDDGRTGFLVPPADAQALAETICKLLADPTKAMELGRNARVRVESQFSIETMVGKYEQLYERLLKSA